jgi:ATP-dependent protease ClpP protease subunit
MSNKKLHQTYMDIFIYGEIGIDVMASEIVPLIHSANDTLNVFINSPGGDVYEGFAIYNALQRKQSILTTYVDGLAYSAASWIALAAKKDKRYMSQASMFGIHRASNKAGGNANELAEQIDLLAKVDEIQTAIYQHSTGLNADEIEAIMALDKPLTFQEAQRFGFKEYKQQKIAAKFSINNNNMDLLKRINELGNSFAKEATKEEAAKAKEQIEVEAKASETPAEALTSELVRKEVFINQMDKFQSFIDAMLKYIQEAPTREDMQRMAEITASNKLTEMLKVIKSAGVVPAPEEAVLHQQDEQAVWNGEMKPDKHTFKEIFNKN